MIYSYSLISTFENCPRQAHARWWRKVPVEDTPEMQTGTRIHKYIEDAITGVDPLPDWLAHVQPIINSLLARGGDAAAEQKMAVNASLQATGFWDKDAYIRGSIDFRLLTAPHALLVDWKTGKKRDKEMQLMLYALFVFAAFPMIDHVTALNCFVADKAPLGQPFTWQRSQVSEMWRTVLPIVHEIEHAESSGQWVAKPSGLCGWCPDKDCQHWRARR